MKMKFQVPQFLSREELLENEQIIENKIIEFHDSKFFGNIRSPRPAPIYSDSQILMVNQLAPLLRSKQHRNT